MAFLSNAQIADSLMSLAQTLSAGGKDRFKAKAYGRAAKTIRTLGESLDEAVRSGADLTVYPGIGAGISRAIQEIVQTGTLERVEAIRSQMPPEVAALSEYPRLDPKRVLRIYKKLHISSVAELKQRLDSGELAAAMGARMAQHVRAALVETSEVLLYDADRVAAAVQDFLIEKCGARRVEAAGEYRRRVEVVEQITMLVDTDDADGVLKKLRNYGGGATQLSASGEEAAFRLPSGAVLRVQFATRAKWGVALMSATGSEQHLRQLARRGVNLKARSGAASPYRDEAGVYRSFGLQFIEPELREGRDEIELAAQGNLPMLVTAGDIRGELHAHSTSSDGRNTIGQMASAASELGYEYVGITDHSKSLKIAGGLTESELWDQIRAIDELNQRLTGIRVLKSAEVDILADGSLDYPDALLKELDYTVCSIHSRFGLGKEAQTERILRAMDNRYFTILGHATGRLLLKRPGYELDVGRVIEHARQNGRFFEINSSPDRLDLSAENARLASQAGVKIAINTDAHSVREYWLVRYGVDQARRAGLEKGSILNCLSWPELRAVFKR